MDSDRQRRKAKKEAYNKKRKAVKVSNYLTALVEMQQQGDFPPGTLTMVNVFHDDWCCFLKGSTCNCKPDFKTMRKITGDSNE